MEHKFANVKLYLIFLSTLVLRDHLDHAEQIVFGKQKLKIKDSSELAEAEFLIYSSKFTYFCIVDIWTLKRNFVKENKKPFAAINTTTNHKNAPQRHIAASSSY